MQNRFILADVPLAARQRGEALREVVEENICWVDRMALLRDGIFAFELHLENMRDLAIEFFNRNEVVLDADGDGALRQLRFRVRAAPVSHPQSAELLEKCPENGKGQTAERLQMLALTLHDGALISLKVRNTPEGGTGSHAWRGGLLLAQHVCLWHSLHHSSTDIPSTVLESLSSCCESTDVLELGAGSTALPSLVLGALGKAGSVTASDSIDEVLQALRYNIAMNELEEAVKVLRLNWADCMDGGSDCNEDESSGDVAIRGTSRRAKYDTIIFADCVYTEAGARLLSNCIARLLDPDGTVIGVLPSFRVGVDVFENALKSQGFHRYDVTDVARHPQQCGGDARMDEEERKTPGMVTCPYSSFHVAGGSADDYRCVAWRRRAWLMDRDFGSQQSGTHVKSGNPNVAFHPSPTLQLPVFKSRGE
jgi:tRNA A58 N-methylase Trm61